MLGSEILEVTMGLIFVYLLASLLCSSVREGIAKLTNVRAKSLEESLTGLLKSDKLVKEVYQNPLIKQFRDEETNKKPHKIPVKKLTSALLDTLANFDKEKTEAFEEIEKGIKGINNARIRTALLDVLHGVESKTGELEEKVEKAHKIVEGWFDHNMENLRTWYRKKTREVLFVIGLIFCVFLNLDTLMIIKGLYHNQGLRESFVSTAMDTVKKPLPATAESSEKKPAAEETTGETPEQPENTAEKGAAGDKTVAELSGALKNMENNAVEFGEVTAQPGFPIGWALDKTQAQDPRGLPVKGDWLAWLYKILGLLITSLAISLGAPFWFDLMKKLADFKKPQN
ncbi:MAG: hypothetical protein KAW12_03320 [Candidatus Aminicenantes bacterium]|nr:hypothetical protein [Candidatus Aminicenantes bacterium]